MPNIKEVLHHASGQIASQTRSDSPRLDAELLLAHCLQQNRTYLFTWPEKKLTAFQSSCFQTLLKQRLEGHPVAHLLGEREFWGLPLKVTPDTLIPRPDTEILVESALEKLAASESKNMDCRILDLGTGSGAIALALKSEHPECRVTAVDFSPKALEVARINAQRHRLEIEFLLSSWVEQLPETVRYDLIVSNPPYIEERDPHLAEGDVRFEPKTALTSGESGLNDLKTIIQKAFPFLKPQGWLMVEHGYNQTELVSRLFKQIGYQHVTTVKDYGDNPRVTIGRKPTEKKVCP